MAIVVLFGGDGSGKSTLANYLRDHHDAVVLHCGYRFKDKMFAYHAAVLRKAVELSKTRLVVLDRHWLCEQVYGHVYRGGSKWPQEGRFMDRVLLKHAAVYVVCALEPKLAGAVVKEHPGRDLYQDQDKAKQVAWWYRLALTGHGTSPESYPLTGGKYARGDVLTYDWRKWTLPTFCRQLLDKLWLHRKCQWAAALDPDATNFGGHIATAGTLLVGDKLNPKNAKLQWPFFEYGNSSLYLAKALNQLGVHETDLIWTNAISDRKPYLPDTLRLAQERRLKVVALGRSAERQCQRYGVNPNQVPHPQWGRRFDSTMAVYLNKLKDALVT